MRTDRTERIAAAVARELGVPELPERLAALDASPLGSLLLAVFRARAGRATPAGLRAAYARAPLQQPSSIDARLLHRADRAAYEAARAFEALELSPVAPAGACAALGGVDPNNVLGALRGAEVLADPTVAFALEAARRRRDRAARGGARRRPARGRERPAAAHPGVAIRLDLSRLEGLGYYPGLAFRVRLEGPAGWLPVGDGGFTPWTQALLDDRKERFLASAIGTELLCKVYGPVAPDGPRASVANPPDPS